MDCFLRKLLAMPSVSLPFACKGSNTPTPLAEIFSTSKSFTLPQRLIIQITQSIRYFTVMHFDWLIGTGKDLSYCGQIRCEYYFYSIKSFAAVYGRKSVI